LLLLLMALHCDLLYQRMKSRGQVLLKSLLLWLHYPGWLETAAWALLLLLLMLHLLLLLVCTLVLLMLMRALLLLATTAWLFLLVLSMLLPLVLASLAPLHPAFFALHTSAPCSTQTLPIDSASARMSQRKTPPALLLLRYHCRILYPPHPIRQHGFTRVLLKDLACPLLLNHWRVCVTIMTLCRGHARKELCYSAPRRLLHMAGLREVRFRTCKALLQSSFASKSSFRIILATSCCLFAFLAPCDRYAGGAHQVSSA